MLVKCFALNTKANIKKHEILVPNYSSCLISISLLYGGGVVSVSPVGGAEVGVTVRP